MNAQASDIFFAVFPGLLCTIHLFWRLFRRFGAKPQLLPPALLCLGMAVWAPARQALEPYSHPQDIVSLLSGIWITLAWFSLAAFLLLDLARLILWPAAKRMQAERPDLLPPRRSVPLALALTACLGLYAWMEAREIRVTRLSVQSDKLPAGVQQLRLLFVSDLHLHGLSDLAGLQPLADLILAQDADLILFGGDMAGGDLRGRPELLAVLAAALPRGGLGVPGDQEARSDFRRGIAPFMENAGIRLLRNDAVLTKGICIAGMDALDPAAAQGGAEPDPIPLLRRLSGENFTILLQHSPYVREESIGLFDLQLSGHSQDRQFLPFQLLTPGGRSNPALSNRRPAGELLTLSGPHGQSLFYASRGAGTLGAPMRFLSPQEIVVLDLLR